MSALLFNQFRIAMLNSPVGSRKAAEEDFVERMLAKPEHFEMLARDYFDRMASTWTARPASDYGAALAKPASGHSVVFAKTPVAADKIDRAVETRALIRRNSDEARARTATAFEAMKAKIREVVLLDLVLPNGKALRDATGAECAKAGGFFTDVAKALKPSQVVDRHLTEDDLKNIKARFYQRNKEDA